jgi:hypothetical protein
MVLLCKAPTSLSVRKEFELSTQFPSRDDLSVFVVTVTLIELVPITSVRRLLPAEIWTSFWFDLPSTRSINRNPDEFLSHLITALLNHETPTIPAYGVMAFKALLLFSDFILPAESSFPIHPNLKVDVQELTV